MARFKGQGWVRDRHGKMVVNFETCQDDIFETHDEATILMLRDLGFQEIDKPEAPKAGLSVKDVEQAAAKGVQSNPALPIHPDTVERLEKMKEPAEKPKAKGKKK